MSSIVHNAAELRKKAFSIEPLGPGWEIWYFMNPNGSITGMSVQNADPVIKANKEEFNSHNSKSKDVFRRPGLGTKVASIPLAFADWALKEKGLNLINLPDKDMKKLLNSSEYTKFRTARGWL